MLAVLAVVRIRQGALVRKQGLAGMAAYLFAGILLLVCAAGMLLDMAWLRAGLLTEMIGAAAFLYGVFLFAVSFFKREKAAGDPDTAETEGGTETRAERNSA
ncbi:hypothetical protein SDC9_162319 [bioreactor metagenome]|uniref:Uncharacterized protein n=1 Tax=bioreactor metagenome TaxID=1076179 RepID=A0A645FM22_9ZZZZ